MGLIGVGIPDIPVFTGFLLRSIYQIAFKVWISYEEEKKKVDTSSIQGAASYGENKRQRIKRLSATSK